MEQLGDECRRKAIELCAKAREQSDSAVRLEYENLAFHYMTLAEQIQKLEFRNPKAA
jgi:hypothetical protein